jgi:hypothetical protein
MFGGSDDEGLDRDSAPTPHTATYNDALLSGRLTRAQMEIVRAEMAGSRALADEGAAPGGLLDQVKQRLDAGDYPGALALAERAHEADPGNAAIARYAEICRKTLGRLYLSQLGASADVPELAMTPAAVVALHLDRWAAFMLAAVDGRTTIEELCDISGMSRLDALRVLFELVKRGVLRIRKAQSDR